jgi:hypothetical protein
MMAQTTLFVLLFGVSVRAETCRDRFLHPFDSTSIWNVAIGDQAEFVAANIYIPRSDQYKCNPPLSGAMERRHECVSGKELDSAEFEVS